MNISEVVKNAGIVGAGGAGFPTYVKMQSEAEIYLVNGAECEPLLKVDQQLAYLHAQELIRGLELGMEATKAKEGIIALKAKYKEAIKALTPFLKSNMRIHILEDVYPSGDEVITIYMATGRRVPPAQIPISIGVVVNNVQTLINVARAVDKNIGVTHKTLTVTGAVKNPITLTVPVGITFNELIDLAGGLTIARDQAAFIDGGPMMGKYIEDMNAPITKATGGIIALPKTHLLIRRRTTDMASIISMARTVCEQCVLCTDLCPRHLIGHELPPHLIVRSANYNHVANPSVLLSALTCSECAVCEAYACPVEISPMRLNQALKEKFRAEGARYQEPIRDADPMINHRFVPISRLITRLELDKYNVYAPYQEVEYKPTKVTLMLNQHIGAPSIPCVQKGDAVTVGMCIATAKDDALSVPVHSSIDGVVESVLDNAIVIKG